MKGFPDVVRRGSKADGLGVEADLREELPEFVDELRADVVDQAEMR